MRRIRNSLKPAPLHRRWLIALAMLALVGTQGLGVVHRALHGAVLASAPAAPAAPAALAALAAAAVQGDSGESAGPQEGFGHEAGSLLCQLFDAAAQAQGLGFAVLSLPQSLLPQTIQALAPTSRLPTAGLAPYEARGPPSAA